jgi:hypothetical protein
MAGAEPLKNVTHWDPRRGIRIRLGNLGLDQGVKLRAFGDEVRFVG